MLRLSGHTAQEERNVETVLQFYDAALNEKSAARSSQFLAASYRQHNPLAADGVSGFRQFVETLAQSSPESHSSIERVFADGEYVILHVHKIVEPGTSGLAIVDIFRLEGGKIVEHWDVTQPIPDQTASGNPML